MAMPLRTRFAPTPSGYLHLGNAWSFVITWLLARQAKGQIRLRIDDSDSSRFRESYLDDIFESLRWLGLDWDSGPRNAKEYWETKKQSPRSPRYAKALHDLQSSPDSPTYACVCSRETMRQASLAQGWPPHLYPGTCRNAGLRPLDEPHVIRYALREKESVILRDGYFGEMRPEPSQTMGDFILRGRSGEAAYPLASVLDDEDFGINFIVRGLDLLPSTGAQLALAQSLSCQGFLNARFLHHALILRRGEKLSKSEGDPSLKAMRESGISPVSLYRYFARALGLSLHGVEKPGDLLAEFRIERLPENPLQFEEFQP